MLNIRNLHAYYGKSHVLHGVNFDIGDGEIVALLGRNGSGRSTTAKAIMNLVSWEGSMEWKGQPLKNRKAYEIAHLGIGYVPESRDVFPSLTVHQNLLLGQKGKGKGSRWSFDDMYAMFPRLKERQHIEAGLMSGGEQQMLTLCRTLMGDPDLIMIDEPTEAHHCDDCGGPRLGDGARQHRFRRYARQPARQQQRAQGMAGGLSARFCPG